MLFIDVGHDAASIVELYEVPSCIAPSLKKVEYKNNVITQ